MECYGLGVTPCNIPFCLPWRYPGDSMPNKLTDVAVRNLRARTARREVRDGGADGLYLVIQPRSGRKSWAMRFRRPDGTPAKLTLGPVDLSARKPKDDDKLRTGMPLTL